ncbi:hypothetical protein Franean1_6616 [Parafrankia sp. EAN1pec]|nr:hypothetical protein Franean1_6616 [Frankia sp. EAN1pec]
MRLRRVAGGPAPVARTVGIQVVQFQGYRGDVRGGLHPPASERVRICNESLAAVLTGHRNRFGFFASVATFHVELAIQHVTYALDALGADSVILTTTGDRYLGDAAFRP